MHFIMQGVTLINLGENILNTHDNIENSDDVVSIQVDTYISTSDLELSNQVECFAHTFRLLYNENINVSDSLLILRTDNCLQM